MNSFESWFHRVGFLLWRMQREHPCTADFFRAMAVRRLRSLSGEFYRGIAGRWESLLPPDRYVRRREEPVQIAIARVSGDARAVAGWRVCANHLRIPYREVPLTTWLRGETPGGETDFLICPFPPDSAVVARCGKNGRTVALFFSDSSGRPEGNEEVCRQVRLELGDVLPDASGPCSEAMGRVVEALLKASSRVALVTGMLPPEIGLRLDDFTCGPEMKRLGDFLDTGWRPNLGVFVRDFLRAEPEALRGIAASAENSALEISPHAFGRDEFIFYDYPRAKPFTGAEFSRRWKEVRSLFDSTGLRVSSVLNPHFHAVSAEALPVLAGEGVKFSYGELYPGTLRRIADPAFLPCGDPTATTGQIWNFPVTQIHSGDSSHDASPDYDFLDGSGGAESALPRILRRLDKALSCGFPAFVTTHGYLLARVGGMSFRDTLEKVRDELAARDGCPVRMVLLSGLGESCAEHSRVIVRSVRRDGMKLRIVLDGRSAGGGRLTLFFRGRRILAPYPAFDGTVEAVVDAV